MGSIVSQLAASASNALLAIAVQPSFIILLVFLLIALSICITVCTAVRHISKNPGKVLAMVLAIVTLVLATYAVYARIIQPQASAFYATCFTTYNTVRFSLLNILWTCPSCTFSVIHVVFSLIYLRSFVSKNALFGPVRQKQSGLVGYEGSTSEGVINTATEKRLINSLLSALSANSLPPAPVHTSSPSTPLVTESHLQEVLQETLQPIIDV